MENGYNYRRGDILNNNRMRQLVFMFSKITGESEENSRKIILLTETGKAVQEGNIVALYEQQTANLDSIARELRNTEYDSMSKLFTVDVIVKAMKELNCYEKEGGKIWTDCCVQISKQPQLGAFSREKAKEAMKVVMRTKCQNKACVRRMENVN